MGNELALMEDFLEDSRISEILVNGLQNTWVERAGILENVANVFASENQIENFVRSMLSQCGRKIDRRTPFADARLPDGSRLCVMMDPAVRGGYHLAIRKFHKQFSDLNSLHVSKMIGAAGMELLLELIQKKKNILVSGATGVGKTTLLNALVSGVDATERILILEDTFELQPVHPHLVRLEARLANNEGEGEISLRQLLRASLRMRPDRLIIGECRGAEVVDLLQALNTGHGGSMASIHANSARDALHRLELLFSLHLPGVQSQVARQFIASAIQVVVHVEKKNGQRQIQSIQELSGCEDGIFLLRNHKII